MNIFSKNTFSVALVFCALSGISAIGQAEASQRDNQEIETVRVSFADLDLSKTEGQEMLEMRVRGAAQQVCGEVYSKSASEVRENRECRQYAVRQALRQVGLEEELAVVVHAR
jgi:UrcA family protein